MWKLIFNAATEPVAPVWATKHTMYVDSCDGKFKTKDCDWNVCELSTETLLFNNDLLSAPDCIYCTDCFVDMNWLCANKFIVCEWVNIYINWWDYIPVIYANDFCNMWTIHLWYSWIDKSFAEATVFWIWVLTNKTSQLNFSVSCWWKGVISQWCSSTCSWEWGKAWCAWWRWTYWSWAWYVPWTWACCAWWWWIWGYLSSPWNATPCCWWNWWYSYLCNPAWGWWFGLCWWGNWWQWNWTSVSNQYYWWNWWNWWDSVYWNWWNWWNWDLTRNQYCSNCYSSCWWYWWNSVYWNWWNWWCWNYWKTWDWWSSVAWCWWNWWDICSYSTTVAYAWDWGCWWIKWWDWWDVIIDCLGNTCFCWCFYAWRGWNWLSSKYTLAILAWKYYNNCIEWKGWDWGNWWDICWKNLSWCVCWWQALWWTWWNWWNWWNVFVYAKNIVCEWCVDIWWWLWWCWWDVCTSNCRIKTQCNWIPWTTWCYMLLNKLNICMNKYTSSCDFCPIILHEYIPSPSAWLAFWNAASNVCLRVYDCNGINICNMTWWSYYSDVHFFMPKNWWFYYNWGSTITIYPFWE